MTRVGNIKGQYFKHQGAVFRILRAEATKGIGRVFICEQAEHPHLKANFDEDFDVEEIEYKTFILGNVMFATTAHGKLQWQEWDGDYAVENDLNENPYKLAKWLIETFCTDRYLLLEKVKGDVTVEGADYKIIRRDS